MSDFLFAQPSLLSGVSRLLDLGGVFDDYNRSRNGMEADNRAGWVDWGTVGQDFEHGIYKSEQALPRQEDLFVENR